MSGVEPTTFDFVGAFLLAGVGGGVGASCGHLLVQSIFDWTPPTSRRRTALLGTIVGIGYPAAWVVALATVRSVGLDGVYADAPVDSGLAAVGASLALTAVLLLVILAIDAKGTGQTTWRGSGIIAFAAVFAAFLPVAFTSLLPILFPRLIP